MNTAFQLAENWHRYHLRKGSKVPYISHLMAVSAIVLEYGGSNEQAQAALLHDVLEDTGLDYEELRRSVGRTIADMVEHCTHVDDDVSPRTPEEWKKRKQKYIDRLLTEGCLANGKIADFVLVTLSDKTHNVETTRRELQPHLDPRNDDGIRSYFSKFNADFDLQKWWYTTLAKTYAEVFAKADRVDAANPRSNTEIKNLLGRFAESVDEIFAHGN